MLSYIDSVFEIPAQLTGASVDELKLIGSPGKKNAFIVGASLFYIIGLFGLWDGLRTLLYSAIGTYAIAYYVDGSLMPWIGFIFLMGHMSISHIYRQIADDSQMVDITGAQMKYSAITEFPSMMDYAGYVLFFPSLFAGPSFEYVDYRRWLDTTLFDVPPGTDPSKRAPPAFKKALVGLLWIGAFVYLGSIFTTDFVLSDEFLQYGFPRRMLTVYLLGFTSRLKYYGVWSLTEGACILSGLGYNGFDPKSGKVFWNRLENVDPWSLETAQNSHAYLGSWNKNTNHWLRNYVYLRRLWHGFYPGYYMTFVLGSFVQTVAKNFRRYVRPFFLTPDGSKPMPTKRYYDFFSWAATQLTLGFAVMPFIILSFNQSMAVWSRVYFYGIVWVVLPHVMRSVSQETVRPPTLGLPNDPERDFDEAVQEVMMEIESRRRRGSVVTMPTGEELKIAVEQRLDVNCKVHRVGVHLLR
ncbi:Membrane bound O-acyl transferase MBOAT [Penicillium verhagenii]|nr:Membrane bound O-acyl transferase MBOAT [Penicillium verhagenii]